MSDMLEAFGRVVAAFWAAPGRPTGSKILDRIYTTCFVLVVGFADYVIFT